MANLKINKDYIILCLIWLIGLVIDRTWFFLDNSIPAYDQSAHLTTALHHYRIFQNLNLLSSDWWSSLWELTPSYRAPFVYICTLPFFILFGKGYDQASLVNLFYTAIIIFSVYHLGNYLFPQRKVGITASIFCLLFPIMGIMRTDYLLDYGLTAIVIFAFTILTFWKENYTRLLSWILAVILGIGIGLIMLSKPTGFIFLFVPGIWTLISLIQNRKPITLKITKFIQLGLSLICAWLICGSWYRLNWLTIITSALGANNVGKTEGDPPAATIDGWLVYLRMIPENVSFPILFVSLGILLLAVFKYGLITNRAKREDNNQPQVFLYKSPVTWLLVFLIGSYLICSLGTNKDIRFILPCFPVISLILAYCFNLVENLWINRLRLLTIGLSAIILINNLFPLPLIQSWGGRHLPNEDGKKYPLAQLIDTINQTTPYLRTTLGVIPVSTGQVNEFTLDYFGTLADFRVYGRKLTMKLSQVNQDLQYLSWYVTRDNEPDEPGERGETKRRLKLLVESSPDLKLQRDWLLPRGDKLRLYNRVDPYIIVSKLDKGADINKHESDNTNNHKQEAITLEKVIINDQIITNQNQSVTYQMRGSWDKLQNGFLLLKWENGKDSWYHDHAVALGNLYCGIKCSPEGNFRVTEHLSTFIPKTLPPGKYQLSALYLDRKTGEITPLNISTLTVNIQNETQNPQNIQQRKKTEKIPPLDLVSRMSQLAKEFRLGKLENLFIQIENFNQYDPTQDYLEQIKFAANYYLQAEPNNLNWRYTLALSQLMQRQVPELIHNLTQITKYDPQNPYAWIYLGFVHLYNFQPRQAEANLSTAEKIKPDIPELKTLKTITNIMKFLPIIGFS
jgi:4-amino-4-deoxy-L-arabinose transferase-like glycosyltransferase